MHNTINERRHHPIIRPWQTYIIIEAINVNMTQVELVIDEPKKDMLALDLDSG